MPSNSCNNFPLPLRGEFHNHGEKIVLLAPFVYEDTEKEILVKVPEGFESDFNSVPRPLWGYFPPWQYPEAGVIHDWLYRHPEGYISLSKKPPFDPLPRRAVDAIHRRILEILGCRIGKRQAAYWALRVGGWKPWNEYRKDPMITDTGKHEPGESQDTTTPTQNLPNSGSTNTGENERNGDVSAKSA